MIVEYFEGSFCTLSNKSLFSGVEKAISSESGAVFLCHDEVRRVLLSLIQMIAEGNKFKPNGWMFLHCIVIISMSILGIIGVACK